MATSGRRSFTLVLDWDGTITNYDTTALIGSRALAKVRAPPGSSEYDGAPTRSMSYYSDAYMADYTAWKSSQAIRSPEISRQTIDEEIAHLSSTRIIEVASFNRVRDAVLGTQSSQDAPPDQESIDARMDEEGEMLGWMEEGGEEAARDDQQLIRDKTGLQALLQRSGTAGNSWSIVSVSWSRMFIAGALTQSGVCDGTDGSLEGRIWCNELVMPEETDADAMDVDDKQAGGLICSVEDKLAAFEAVTAEHAEALGDAQHEPQSIYVGDSTTDLGCLLAADIGICMRAENVNPEDDKLARTLERLGISCRHIKERPFDGEEVSNELYWTTTFKDIKAFLDEQS